MKRSEPFKEMIPDLIKAQKIIKPILKKGKNPHFKSEYAEYDDVIEEVKKALNENKMWVSHTTYLENDKLIMETIILHTSGEWCATELPVINKAGTDQGLGSSLSYVKRYSILGLTAGATADDDGNEATQKPGSHDPASAYFDELPPQEEFEKKMVDHVFTIGTNKGKKFSEALNKQGYLLWVKEQIDTNYAKTHQELKDFYHYAKGHGAIK